MSHLPSSLVLVGAGKMGGALLEGWLALGLEGARITAIDPHPAPQMIALCAKHHVRLNPTDAVAAPQALVLAIKPQMLDEAASALKALVGPHTLVLSIMAGKTIANISARVTDAPTQPIVRAMPNTPASVGRGITGAFANAAVSTEQRAMAHALLAGVGQVEWLADENLIDAVTAVSGSGPAYVFYLVECLAKAGQAAGLPDDIAMRLARATVEGSGELLFRDGQTEAAQLRKNVTSPGGTTAAALEVLMASNGLAPLMERAIAAAARRAGELSG